VVRKERVLGTTVRRRRLARPLRAATAIDRAPKAAEVSKLKERSKPQRADGDAVDDNQPRQDRNPSTAGPHCGAGLSVAGSVPEAGEIDLVVVSVSTHTSACIETIGSRRREF
jgi:hypothetical protein